MCECKCGWPIYTTKPATINCQKCGQVVECIGGGVKPTPQPPDVWPTWANAIARFRKTIDTGVGDTAQRIAAKFGGEQFKIFAKTLGMPCGCTERQKDWNTRYPYEQSPSQK